MITKIDGITYGKPSVTDLPPELGKQIFKEILSSKVPDREKMKEQSAKLMQQMRIELEKEDE